MYKYFTSVWAYQDTIIQPSKFIVLFVLFMKETTNRRKSNTKWPSNTGRFGLFVVVLNKVIINQQVIDIFKDTLQIKLKYHREFFNVDISLHELDSCLLIFLNTICH